MSTFYAGILLACLILCYEYAAEIFTHSNAVVTVHKMVFDLDYS